MSEPEPEGQQKQIPVIEDRPDSEVETPPPHGGGPRTTDPTRQTPEDEAKAKGLPEPKIRGKRKRPEKEIDKRQEK